MQTTNAYTAGKWNRIAILGKELGWPAEVHQDDLWEFGNEFLGGPNALMFIRRTKKLQRGNNWFKIPQKDECPANALAKAMIGTNYLYASIRARPIPSANSLTSDKLLQRFERTASKGPFVFYVFHGVASDPMYSYVKIGYARTPQHAHSRRQFRIKRDALAFRKEGISLRWLCAVPLTTEKDARWLEKSFEDTYGTLCQRLREDQNRRSGMEFYQPADNILDFARKLGERYPPLT
jgi:hypothetical protein